MKILSLGTDKSVLDPNSKTAKRIAVYKSLVEEYIVLVPQGTNKILGFFDLFARAKKIIKEKKINILTSQDPYFLGLIAVLLGKKLNLGVEVQVHGWEKFNFLRKKIARFVLRRANSIRVVSQRLKKQLVEDFKIKEEKITVVPIHIEIKQLELKMKDKKSEEKFIFLTVGRLVPVKNINLQIEAMAEIVKKYPNVELWIVGDGPERKRLELLAANYSLLSNVKFLGWQSDVEKYYRSVDVFVLTSNNEGWGLVVVEAASYGLPIIMTDVGCAGEVIINQQSGIVIPVGDKQKLVESMISLFDNKNLYDKLSNGAFKSARNLLSKEKTIDLYLLNWKNTIL